MAEEGDSGSGPSIEQRATEMGWVPKDQWRGDPAHWADAGEYVRRGEQIVPILQSRERKTSQENQTLRSELQQMRQILQANQETIQALTEFNSADRLERAKTKKEQIISAITAARQENDVERETRLQDQLSQTNEAIRKAEEKPAQRQQQQPQQQDPNNDPVFREWRSQNSWFGTDQERTALAGGVAANLRAQNPNMPQKEFLEQVAARVSQVFDTNNRRAAPARVGGSGNGNGGSASAGKRYEDLPVAEKEACERFSKRVVGEGRAYKTQADWQKAYAAKYFEKE